MNDLRKVDHREMRQFAMQFRELMYEMPFQLPHNLIVARADRRHPFRDEHRPRPKLQPVESTCSLCTKID